MNSRKALAVAGMAILLAGCGPDEKEDETSARSPGGGTSTEPQQTAVSMRADNVGEGLAGNGVTLTLTPAPTDSVKMSVSVEGGTAEIDKDFTMTLGAMDIVAGARTAKIPINVIDDDIFEGDEEVQVQIRVTSGNARLAGSDKISVLIKDNDSRPELELPNDLRSVAESVGSVNIPLKLSHPSSVDHTVDIEVSGTATRDVDYIIDDEDVVFAAGETEATVKVDILTDRLVEGGETILLDFTSSEGIVSESGQRYSLIISPEALLNDTGMTLFGDGRSLSPAPQGPQQDAHYGRDVSEPVNEDGRNGFRFSKLDKDGNTLPLSATSWRCVRDKVSGLIWETKTEDVPDLAARLEAEPPIPTNNYRAADYGYTWFTTDVSNSGGSAGAPNDRIRIKPPIDPDGYCAYKDELERRHQLACNTDTYTVEVNWYGLCGSKQWRLPDIEEMRSLVDYELVELDGNGLDPRFFPRNKDQTYYSGTPSAEFDASAWCVDMATGEVKLCHKGFLNKVRLVAEGQGEAQ